MQRRQTPPLDSHLRQGFESETGTETNTLPFLLGKQPGAGRTIG